MHPDMVGWKRFIEYLNHVLYVRGLKLCWNRVYGWGINEVSPPSDLYHLWTIEVEEISPDSIGWDADGAPVEEFVELGNQIEILSEAY